MQQEQSNRSVVNECSKHDRTVAKNNQAKRKLIWHAKTLSVSTLRWLHGGVAAVSAERGRPARARRHITRRSRRVHVQR